ncbi:hypothetical protein T12_11379 [Trichinella patagoniensis]|uniref:Uncharacterized protein n=1 Tax=Trichinella patagoniensis TaxID=990121 RepID=A0A0V0ZVP9_9BILA|nr:hypothetical protein T12_11379 [Trichinella patagoniensis]
MAIVSTTLGSLWSGRDPGFHSDYAVEMWCAGLAMGFTNMNGCWRSGRRGGIPHRLGGGGMLSKYSTLTRCWKGVGMAYRF